MGMPGFRRPLAEGEEVHEFSRPPRNFEETEEGGYRFTVGAPDLRSPLTAWLAEDDPVTVDYHTDLEGDAKARFQLLPAEPEQITGDNWMEQPTRILLQPAD